MSKPTREIIKEPINSSEEDLTHFGFQTIPKSEKKDKVASVFNSVASQYNLMNDLMSFGLHRLWKRMVRSRLALQPHHQVLDLAGGSGDLSALFTQELKASGKTPGFVVLADINAAMLQVGRQNLLDKGLVKPIAYLQTDAECLPFPNNSFDRIALGFGLRNITHKDAALKEMFRILKPGGRVVILEFSHPQKGLLNTLYQPYSFKVIPLLGKWVCKDQDSYQYLAESIRMHPDQETLKSMMIAAGFERVEYQNIHSGIVALHIGFKF